MNDGVPEELLNKMKLVSVIIPCFKDSNTLGRAISSILSQSYPAVEIIVVNDSSPESDAIEALLLDYPMVRYLRNLVNVGLAASRNKGLQAARGEIVAFLDADDEYHPKKIELQLAALEPNTVVTCNLTNKYPNGRTHVSNARSRVFERADDILFRNILPGACLLARRELLIGFGGYDSKLRSSEDYDLWLRLLVGGVKVKFLGEPLYIYWFNPAGLSKNFRNISKWEIEVIKNHAARMGGEWSGKLFYARVLSVWIFRHLMRAELSRDHDLRSQTISNIELLNDFPITKLCVKFVAHSRVLVFSSLVVSWFGGLRSGG